MALLTHRRYLGIEINPKYAEIARRRLREAEAKLATKLEEIA
jgi:DNA modification methylase